MTGYGTAMYWVHGRPAAAPSGAHADRTGRSTCTAATASPGSGRSVASSRRHRPVEHSADPIGVRPRVAARVGLPLLERGELGVHRPGADHAARGEPCAPGPRFPRFPAGLRVATPRRLERGELGAAEDPGEHPPGHVADGADIAVLDG